MIRLEKKSKRDVQDIKNRAIEFFGPAGLGLTYDSSDPSTLSFEGGGGGVNVIIAPHNGSNSVEVLSQEWDYQAKKFVEEKL